MYLNSWRMQSFMIVLNCKSIAFGSLQYITMLYPAKKDMKSLAMRKKHMLLLTDGLLIGGSLKVNQNVLYNSCRNVFSTISKNLF